LSHETYFSLAASLLRFTPRLKNSLEALMLSHTPIRKIEWRFYLVNNLSTGPVIVTDKALWCTNLFFPSTSKNEKCIRIDLGSKLSIYHIKITWYWWI